MSVTDNERKKQIILILAIRRFATCMHVRAYARAGVPEKSQRFVKLNTKPKERTREILMRHIMLL